MPTLLRALALALLTVFALAPGAFASSRQESMFQDDDLLTYSGSSKASSTLDTLQNLGVDRVRVTVKWSVVAPNPDSRRRPSNFDATNPAAYEARRPGAWDRYDALVRLARAKGMKLNFNVSAPAPLWATAGAVPAKNFPDVYAPKAAEFARFVTAVGRRYSGSYAPPAAPPATTQPGGVIPPITGMTESPGAEAAARAPALPRVSFWSIWNEPNVAMWLTPQWRKTSSGRWVPFAAAHYRSLLVGAHRALTASGHRRDTILAGELAARGLEGKGTNQALKPLAFIRQLYCVDRKVRPLRGQAAKDVGCPTSGRAADVVRAAPELFALTAWAHHPYSLIFAPNVRSFDRDFVTLADLKRLESLLDRIFKRYGKNRKLGLWLTEYGYQTGPPDPYQPYGAKTQGAFLNQADWMTFRNPRVKALTQFLLDDDPPRAGATNSRDAWGTFQSGLRTSRGKPKASFAMYRLPLYLPKRSVRRGQRLGLFGLVRPADNGAKVIAQVQFRAKGAKKWKRVKLVRFRSPRNSFRTTVKYTRTGDVRIGWGSFRSRAVRVTVKR